MRGVKTGDLACRNAECPNRVPKRAFCEQCKRVMAEQVRATNRLLFPAKRTVYTPRVVKVLHGD